MDKNINEEVVSNLEDNLKKIKEQEEITDKEIEKLEEIKDVKKEEIKNLKDENTSLNNELEEKSKKFDNIKNSYVRLLADFENLKKRTKKEVQDIKKYATTSLLKDFLPIIDNMERALEHSKLDEQEADDPLVEGIKLVHKQFIVTLEKHLVKPFESLHKPFDPMKHEALQMVESEEFDENIVVNEYEKGYLIGERLLRPAKVIVSKKN